MSVSPWNACLFLVSLSAWPIVFLLPSTGATHISKANATLEFLQRTFDSLDFAMAFFRREHRHVNLDSVIGTRLVEATMNIVMTRLKASDTIKDVPPHIVDRILRLRDESSDISKITIPYIFINEPDYAARIGPILRRGLFRLNFASRDVNHTPGLVWPYNPHEVMKEDDSDKCLSEIFGTKSGVKCDISQACWDRMTAKGYNGYSLSHQIFYLEIAQGYGCGYELSIMGANTPHPHTSYYQELFCANMLAEANLIAQAGFPATFQDLFMEQAALCGILGYREFFRFDWLEKILAWQDGRDGCFKWKGWPVTPRLLNIKSHTPAVTKREERRVSRGCLCHRTSVASGALAQYVRYLLETYLEQRGEEAI